MTKTTLVGIAKDEGPFLWEWVAYHRSIGFSNILIFENDSTDFSQRMLKVMDRAGFISYFPNPAHAGRHQNRAYQRVSEMPIYQSSDWVMAIDLDEFLNIKVGDGTVQELTSRGDDLDCYIINWRIFGNSYQNQMEPCRVTERFVMCNSGHMITHYPLGHKGFFRPSEFTRPGVHKPVLKDAEDTPRIANGSGNRIDRLQDMKWYSTDPSQQTLVQLNHYILKDTESFIHKAARGRAHQNNAQVRHTYWVNNNFNQSTDVSILRHMERVQRVMQDMDNACSGELSRITQRAYRVHRKRIDELLLEDEFRDLYQKCSGITLPTLDVVDKKDA